MEEAVWSIASGASLLLIGFICRFAYTSSSTLKVLAGHIKLLSTEIESFAAKQEDHALELAKTVDKIADILEKHHEVTKDVAVLQSKVDAIEIEDRLTGKRLGELERKK